MTFYCTYFTGRYEVPVAIIADASTPEAAAEKMNVELRRNDLPGDVDPKKVFPLNHGAVVLLNDGDY